MLDAAHTRLAKVNSGGRLACISAPTFREGVGADPVERWNVHPVGRKAVVRVIRMPCCWRVWTYEETDSKEIQCKETTCTRASCGLRVSMPCSSGSSSSRSVSCREACAQNIEVCKLCASCFTRRSLPKEYVPTSTNCSKASGSERPRQKSERVVLGARFNNIAEQACMTCAWAGKLYRGCK